METLLANQMTTIGTDQDMAADRSGSDIMTLDPYLPVTDAPQHRSSSDTESKPKKSKRKKKNQAKQKTHVSINALVGPQKDTWTKFFVLNFIPENNEPPMSNMKIWVGLRKLLPNNEFSCVRRSDGSVLVDAKTKRNAQIIASLNELWSTKVSTS